MADIPSSWVLCTLSDFCDVEQGQSPPSASYSDDPARGTPFLQGNAEFGSRFPTIRKWTSQPQKRSDDRAVLLSVRAPVGDTNLSLADVSIGRGLSAVTPLGGISREFVFWLLRSRRQELETQATGTTFPAVTGRVVRALPVVLPPLGEQREIVAAVERGMQQIDDGIDHVKRSLRGISAYEAAVYGAALRGDLAPPGDEDPSEVLHEHGVPLLPPDEYAAHWPAHWQAVHMGDLCSRVTSGSRDWKPYYHQGTGVFVLTQSVRMRKLDMSTSIRVDPPPDDPARARSSISKGDLLVTIVGANVGNTARVPADYPEHFVCQSLALLRPRVPSFGEFLEIYMSAPLGGQRYFEGCFYGQGRPHLSFEDLKAMPVPIPPPDEQADIVRAFDDQMRAAGALRSDLEGVQHQAEELRSSLLHSAFSGHLTQQRHGETAEALLQAIGEGRPPNQRRKKRRAVLVGE